MAEKDQRDGLREARCVGCGCTDRKACPGGCAWYEVDRRSGIGFCTRCAGVPLSKLDIEDAAAVG